MLKPGHRMHFSSKKVDDFLLVVAHKTQAANAADYVKIKQIKRSDRPMVTFLFSVHSQLPKQSNRQGGESSIQGI